MRKETSLMASRGRSIAQPWVWFSEMSALSSSLSLICIQSLWQMSVTPLKRFPPNAILFNDTHCQQPQMLSDGGTFAVSDCLSLLTGLLTRGGIERIIIKIEIVECFRDYIYFVFNWMARWRLSNSSDGSRSNSCYDFYAQITQAPSSQLMLRSL